MDAKAQEERNSNWSYVSSDKGIIIGYWGVRPAINEAGVVLALTTDFRLTGALEKNLQIAIEW